jgi:hypothetical protein
MEKRHTLQRTSGTNEFDALVRHQCKLIKYSNNLLEHLAPLWETGVYKWNNLLTIKHTSPTAFTYHIHPTDAILAKLPRGNKTSPKIRLRMAIVTLRSPLLLPDGTEYRKIPKDLTKNITLIHPSWHTYITKTELTEHTPTSYATLSKTHLIQQNP